MNSVTCVDLNFLDQSGIEESVCLQCPDGTAGDGRECRGTQHLYTVTCFYTRFHVYKI